VTLPPIPICSLKLRGEKPYRFLPGPSSRRYSAFARRLRARSRVPPPGPSPFFCIDLPHRFFGVSEVGQYLAQLPHKKVLERKLQ